MTVDLDATELAEPVRTAENTALVLIDFQRDFCEAGGYADTIDDIGFAREVVPRALRLLHAARERSLTIVHTREGYAPDLSDCSLQRRLRSARVGAPIGSVGPLGRLLIRGEFGHDFISELTPEESELVGGDTRVEERRAPVERVGPAVTPVRVVLAEDDVLLREGLASLLDRSGFDVVGQAVDGAQLLALVRDIKPELVVTDIRMPPTHSTEGLDAAQVIRDEFPDIAILVLSAHVEVEHAMELLASGRSIGYLLKNRVTDVADFLETLERIAKGASVVDPVLVRDLVSTRRRDDPLAVLSGREQEVLALIAEGRSNAGIGRRLWVTEGTVEKHIRSIMTRLNLHETGDDHRRVLAALTFLQA